MARSLTIIHVSDIHLHFGGPIGRRFGGWTPHQHIPKAHRPREHAVTALQRDIASRIADANVSGDVIAGVLSGDLSLMGKQRDVDCALDWWEDALSGHTSVHVLGNHDYWGGSLLLAVPFHRHVHGQVKRDFPRRGAHIDLPGVRVRIYVLDTTPRGFRKNGLADGEVHTEDVERLRLRIARHDMIDQRDGIPSARIVVMHHPMLVDFWRLKAFTRLYETSGGAPGTAFQSMPPASQYVSLFKELGASLVLAGHTHAWARHDFKVLQAVSASSTLPTAGYWVHRLTSSGEGDALLESTRYAYDTGRFRSVDTFTAPSGLRATLDSS
jgi:predicted phosphohydrolase